MKTFFSPLNMIAGLVVSIFLVIAVFVGLNGCSSGDQEARELFIQARELQANGEYVQAIEIYRKVVTEYPKSHEAINSQFMVGYIYANDIKNYELAKTEYNRFLERYSDLCVGTDDEGLVISARFELLNMGKPPEEFLPILRSSEMDTVVATTELGDTTTR